MQSTLQGTVPKYIGADLTDRYSAHCRDIDVCGLETGENKRLRATFWHWCWDPPSKTLEVHAIASELGACRVSMLDGPQALAIKGAGLRVCERQSAAVGKTPDHRPGSTSPFAGFICSSLDLFTALKQAGVAISPPGFIGGVSEVYPGHIWTILSRARSLPQKGTAAGRWARKRILEALGVCELPCLPTHDQNDACVAALMAAAAGGGMTGVSAAAIGAPLFVDFDGTLREGPMVVPEVAAVTGKVISEALEDLHLPDVTVQPGGNSTPTLTDVTADELLALLISKAAKGEPEVCTYAWAYRALFKTSYTKFSQAYANRVIGAARRTHARELPGLGLVHLDTFIVSKKDRLPSDGYWPAVQHDREDWERVLGDAKVLE